MKNNEKSKNNIVLLKWKTSFVYTFLTNVNVYETNKFLLSNLI